jgi:hypothetical protein
MRRNRRRPPLQTNVTPVIQWIEPMPTTRIDAERLLDSLFPLTGSTSSADHTKLLHGCQRLAAQVRGISRQLDSLLNQMTDACRLLAYRSANDPGWKKGLAVAVALLSRDRNAVTKVPEIKAVRRWFDAVNRQVRQLPPSVFQSTPGGRPDVSPPQRRVIEVDAAGRERLMAPDDPILTGKSVPVQSSNVQSVSFELNQNRPERSQLRVQYWQQDPNSGTKQPGPVYGYSPVSPQLFRRLLRSGSSGSWVWDNLRVRGTVSGHRVPYTLLAARGHIPRRAVAIGGREWFVRRHLTALLPAGRTRSVQSSLPSRPVSVRAISRRPTVSRMP